MANVRWTGKATAVAQVDTFTPATVEIDDIFTLTITGWDGTSTVINFTATAATVANVTAGLTAAWNASTNALCTPITAADATTHMTLTADTAGVAFSVASSTTQGGANNTQTLTRAATTASAGPEHWDSAANWSGGAVPGGAAAQEVTIEDWSGDIMYGLDQSDIANTLTRLTLGKSFSGRLGVAGAAGYAGTYLQIKATAVNVGPHAGTGSPSGSGRTMINTGSTASTVTISATSTTSADANKPACRLLADSAATVINVLGGAVGIAFDAGETATVGTINAAGSTASVFVGSGVTLTTLTNAAAAVQLKCAATTVTSHAGSLTTTGSGAITTLTINGGTAYPNAVGIITTLNALGGITDFTQSPAARTVTTAKLGIGGRVKYDPSALTLTNHLQPSASSGVVSFAASAA